MGHGRESVVARLQRPLIIVAVVGIVLLGIVAILQVLARSRLGETESKLLSILGALALFSLTALAASLRLEKDSFVFVGWIGIVASGLSLLLATVAILSRRPDLTLMKLLLSAVVLATTAALGSLVLLVHGRDRRLDLLALTTLSVLGVTAAIWIAYALSGEFPRDGKPLGVLSILSWVGVGVTTLLARLQRLKGGA